MQPDLEGESPSPRDPALEALQSIANLHARGERAVARPQRWVESAIAAVGRPGFLAATLAAIFLWIAIDTLMARLTHQRPFDPAPYNLLQGVSTLTALLLTIMILIAQNRQTQMAERRAQLDLHISLIADQRNAKIISLLEELRRDLPQVPDRLDPEAEAMQSAADPEAMLVALDYLMTEAAATDTPLDQVEVKEITERLETTADSASPAG